MPQHTTTASEAPCRHCGRPLLHAWDEGLHVRADAAPLDAVVAEVLRQAGRRVYVRTRAGHLILESVERVGWLRLVIARHAEHVCPRAPSVGPGGRQLELFDTVLPPARREGLW